MRRSLVALGALLALVAGPAAAQETPRMGGVLEGAMIGEPPTPYDGVQTLFHEDVGRIELGDYFALDVTREDLRGFGSTPDLFFWNAWLAK